MQENNNLWTDEIKCSVWDLTVRRWIFISPTWKAMPPVYVMTDAYMVTTATHADKLVLAGNTNQM